jgi:hypothetical protein
MFYPRTCIQLSYFNQKRKITSMFTKKTFLQFIGLALILWLLAGCGNAPTQPTPTTTAVDFTGHWEGLSSAFSLDLVQSGEKLQGGHAVIAQQGNKIDSLDKSIEGNILGNKVAVHFQSSFTTNTGSAEITFIDEKTIFWKVTSAPDGENYFPLEATLSKKAPASNSSPAKSGAITGQVHLMAPPTPKMMVYAVDKATGLWASTQTEATDSVASFSLAVQPGTYQVFAAVDVDGGSVGLGYSTDGLTLTQVTVATGQTITDINVRPPSQSECGSMMGYPASPDGRFAATVGPTAACLTSIANPVQPQTNVDATRIQFQPNTTSWQTPGDLAPNASIRFVLSALKGQILTVELTTNPDSGAGPSASVNITGADGKVYTPDITTKWQGVLMTSQDYYIEVRSLSQQNITYSLVVAIPAIGSTPYVPVTQDVCQMLQEMAAQALSVNFTLEASAPFTDPITNETGQGCNLTATGNGNNFSGPSQVTAKLASGFGGFTENPAYQAGGPTGAATAVTRDMAVVLISANWVPAPEAKCPSDQPISACNLKPEQKLYTIKIQAAMK